MMEASVYRRQGIIVIARSRNRCNSRTDYKADFITDFKALSLIFSFFKVMRIMTTCAALHICPVGDDGDSLENIHKLLINHQHSVPFIQKI